MSLLERLPSGPDRFSTTPHADEPNAGAAVWSAVRTVLAPIASLKLTVVLLGLATFLVLAGTLAQADQGIETVVRNYFRARPWEAPRFGFAWIPLKVFVPAAFFPNALAESRPNVGGGFWCPGGWLIGLVMFANLLAAHTVRFTVQSRGLRLWGGLGVLAAGIGLTWLVVASGDLAGEQQGSSLLGYGILWRVFQVAVVMAGLANVAAVVWLHLNAGQSRKVAWLATIAAPATVGLAVWAVLVGEISGSSMRILWQLIKAEMAAGVLLAGCMLVFKQRSGIVLLHAGVGLLMISELLVGLQAVETQMRLFEGETSNMAQDIRSVELAVVDVSAPDTETVTAIPSSLLKAGKTLKHQSLPFAIRIDQYFPNAELHAVDANTNPATAGIGLQFAATAIPQVAGTDSGGAVDVPAAYATVLDGTGQEIGTYLLSADRTQPQTIQIAGKPWELALRFERHYKPYAVTLNDVRADNYVGTDSVRNYSSDVHVVSAASGTDFTSRIWMNNPLRYMGETLYQQHYGRAGGSTGPEYTILQIVRNTGWMLPYVSCMIVMTGLMAQFLMTLLRYLGRRAEGRFGSATESISGTADVANGGMFGRWVFPVAVTAIFGFYLLSKAMPPRPVAGEPNLAAFGTLPVASHGRVKPLDTVARDALKTLSDNRQTFADAEGNKLPAIRWLADFIADPASGGVWKVVRIDNSELLDEIGLPKDRKNFSYSIEELVPTIPALTKRTAAARQKRAADKALNATDRAAFALEQKIGVVDTLLRSFQPQVRDLVDNGFADYADRYRIFKFGDTTTQVPSRNPPLVVNYNGEWETLAHASLMEMVNAVRAQQEGKTYEPAPAVAAWTTLLADYRAGNAADFDRGVARYQRQLAETPPAGYEPAKVGFESDFNAAAPFYYTMIPYLLAALLAATGWLGWNRPLARTASGLIYLAFAVHTLALIGRIYISGRPPVTNLYSSAIFIGWAAVAFGIGLEWLFKLGFGNVLAGIAGFATLLIAHNLAAGEDTFAVLQAVLDTQFWLATHVVCITLGYTATYVSGILGLMYIVLGVATPMLGRTLQPRDGRTIEPASLVASRPANRQTLGGALIRQCYGILCFAILFSFVGTVLGGLWADDSWGRFWGWDPKENGALIIVLWNALVLHARWGGMVKDRGLAVLAVLGNVAVSWSWFGTNELGVGLHSYGFTDGVLLALGLFVLSQFAVAAMGCLPKSLWRSSARTSTTA